MKLFIILIAMLGMVAGALHAYQKKNLLVQAALLSEGFVLSESVKSSVSNHYVRHGIMPNDNQSVNLPPANSIYGTSVKRIAVNLGGVVSVDFDKEIGKQNMVFTPSVNMVSGQLEWRCHSDSIDPDILGVIKPSCEPIVAVKEGKLMHAIANDNADAVEFLLGQGANPNAVVHGNTPLMLAAKMGNVVAAKQLLSKGASIDNNALNSERRTPLMVAITSNRAEMVALLLSEGASVTQRDYKGLTAHEHAINTDRRLGGERYELMVLAKLNPRFVGRGKAALEPNEPTQAQKRAQLLAQYNDLVQSAQHCNVHRLAKLLQQQNDLDVPEIVGGKPLSHHVRKPECSTSLMEHIKDKRSYKEALDVRFSEVVQACDQKQTEVLLSENPSIDVLSLRGAQSHFDRAMTAGCTQLVAYLIRELGLDDQLNKTVLLAALKKVPQSSLVEVCGILISAGADVNARDSSGQSVLGAAISFDQPVIAKYLVDAGADINAPTMAKSYPLIEATKKGYNHLVIQLVRQGAQINQQDSMGRTALIAAVAGGRQRLVDTLLRAGANALLRDVNGIDAIMLAETKQFKPIHTQLTASASN